MIQKKQFLKDTFITLITNVMRLLFGIGISIILARYLGPEKKGIYTLTILLPSLIVVFINFGLAPSTIYYTAKREFPLSIIAGNNLIISFLLGVTGFIFSSGLIILFKNHIYPDIPRLYLTLGLLTIPLIIVSQHNGISFLLGTKEILKYNAVGVIHDVLFLTLLLMIVILGNISVIEPLLIKILVLIIVTIIIILWIRRKISAYDLKLNKDYIKKLFSYGYKTYLGNIIGFLNYRVEVFILGLFVPAAEIGFYSIAVGIAEKLWFVSRSTSTIIFPVIAAENSEEAKKNFTPIINRNVIFLTLTLSIVLFFISNWIIKLLYTDLYFPSIKLFNILLPGIVFLSSSRIFANDIAGRGKPLLNTIFGSITLIIQVILNLVLVPKYRAIGAALSTSVTYFIGFLMKLVAYKKLSSNNLYDILIPHKSDFSLYKKIVLLIISKFRKDI